MHLTGKQRRQLETALLSAFPSRDALTRMVAYQLDQNLAAIAGGDTLAAVVFNLVGWAHATGQIEQLIAAAQAENPGNPELRAFAAQRAIPPATQAPSATVNPTGPQDIYARYETGTSELLRRMGQAHPRYGEALTYQQRLRENIAFARQFGDTETRQSDRAVIIAQLNNLALAVLGRAFNDLLTGAPDPHPPGNPARPTDGQRQRLEKQRAALQQELDLRVEKAGRLRQALAIETSVAVKFQLEQQLQTENDAIAQLEHELDAIEQRL
jgi:hypothetical protein